MKKKDLPDERQIFCSFSTKIKGKYRQKVRKFGLSIPGKNLKI